MFVDMDYNDPLMLIQFIVWHYAKMLDLLIKYYFTWIIGCIRQGSSFMREVEPLMGSKMETRHQIN